MTIKYIKFSFYSASFRYYLRVFSDNHLDGVCGSGFID